jgi:hypothetical protein
VPYLVALHFTHIVSKAEHDLRCSVPARRNILRHESLVACRFRVPTTWTRGVAAREAKVADLELTISIDKEISDRKREELNMESRLSMLTQA